MAWMGRASHAREHLRSEPAAGSSPRCLHVALLRLSSCRVLGAASPFGPAPAPTNPSSLDELLPLTPPQVATPDDPASARRGEPLYAFIPRSVWGNLVDG